MLIDTHCHLEDYDNLKEITEEMQDGMMITAGTSQTTNEKVLELIAQYPNVYGTLGIHPEEVENCKEEDLIYIEKHIMDPHIVGIGEVGLDYHYGTETKEKQKEILKKQLLLAKKYKKTVVIHSRDATLDTYTILEELDMHDTKMVLHCYSSSIEMAHQFLKFPMKFGIGGVITFKNAVKLREVVEKLPLESFLLETDSPYLSPEPHRGEKNKPSNTLFVAKKIAEIKGISLEEVLQVTSASAIRWFDLGRKI
ncbi:MAG: TatD family hydrolase [Bacilli bacterium]|nr:TatD family hydrolase [Bacilli bacterium]